MAEFDFAARSQLEELMDTEPVGFEEFRACLVDLARVNGMTRAYAPTLSFLERLLARRPKAAEPLTIVDVGSGYGDMLRRIDAWARRRGTPVSLIGVDINPWSARAATEATPRDRKIRWVTADAFGFEAHEGIDVVLSSLFTHHLSDRTVVEFLRWMESNARVGWFVSDLHRHPVPFHVFRHLARLARFHRFVQHDGPVSILRAFESRDWTRLLEGAGIASAAVEVRWEIPFRLTVGRIKRG